MYSIEYVVCIETLALRVMWQNSTCFRGDCCGTLCKRRHSDIVKAGERFEHVHSRKLTWKPKKGFIKIYSPSKGTTWVSMLVWGSVFVSVSLPYLCKTVPHSGGDMGYSALKLWERIQWSVHLQGSRLGFRAKRFDPEIFNLNCSWGSDL